MLQAVNKKGEAAQWYDVKKLDMDSSIRKKKGVVCENCWRMCPTESQRQ